MFLLDVTFTLSPTGGNDLQIDPPVPPSAHWNRPPMQNPLLAHRNRLAKCVLHYLLVQTSTTKQQLLGVPSSLSQHFQIQGSISLSVRGTSHRSAHEPQECPRNPGARGFGRLNSGTWFEAAQLQANRLAAAAGGRALATKCAVAGLGRVSDTSFGGKKLPWHGVYGAQKTHKPCRILPRMHVIACNHVSTCKACRRKYYVHYMRYMGLQCRRSTYIHAPR